MNQPSTITQLPRTPVRAKFCNALTSDKRKVGEAATFWTNHYEISLPAKFKSFSLFSLRIVDELNEPVEPDQRVLVEEIGSEVRRKVRGSIVRGMVMWIFNEKEPDTSKHYTVTVEGEQYHVQLNPAKTLSLAEALKDSEGEYVINQMFNVLVKGAFKSMGYIDITKRQQYFNPSQSEKLRHLVLKQFYVWQGYPTSVRMINQRPMLCIDTKSKILRNETALDRMLQCKTFEAMKSALIGECVTADYGTSRTYRIHAISEMTPASVMNDEHTFASYLLKKYQVKVRDMQQNLLVHDPCYGKKYPNRSLDKVYLVPELMRMTGLTAKEKSKREIMRELAVLTKVDPATKKRMIGETWREIDAILSEKELVMQPVTASGIVMHPPRINSGTGWQDQKNPNQIFLKRFYEGAAVKRWVLVYDSYNKEDDQYADSFQHDLMETAASFGMKLAEPIVLAMTTDDPKAWCESIAKKHAESPLQLVVCCFIDKKRDYEQMKRFLSCELGVPNQCMAFDTYFRNKKPLTVAQNIAKQINAKLGKAAYLVEKPAALKKAMLIGIDVFHRTSSNQGSWAGFVSTVDEEFSQFYSDGIKHHRGEELMARAPEYVGKALVRFVEKNKYRPETIVIYRDGVGEGQVDKLIQIEINGILDLFAERNYKPNFIVVLVNKRIAKRYFDGNSNPKPGSIVYDNIVSRGKEFLLTAQHVTEGSATPTLYQIVSNNSNFSEETIWQLTYWQCYNYSNWAGPVRVPAVCQYAHKVAYAYGDTLKKDVKPTLLGTLYQL